MKQGDLIGITTGAGWLYCSVEEVQLPDIEFFVINGHWNFKLNIETGKATVFTPFGYREEKGWRIAFIGHLPNEVCGNYNRAIEYMEKNPGRPLALWFWRRTLRIRGLVERFQEACRAFSDSWHGRKPLAAAVDDFDNDQIPF